ncbi:MAG TPA: hypothetical protein VF593_02100, partial [Chthoniobacteraceae bacterium]
YVINQNGILFGGSSQINLRSLTASSLPINDNLIQQGLLNNRDAQFLFSAMPVPGGSDGTPAFNPTISDRAFQIGAAGDTYTLREAVAVNPAKLPLRAPEFTFAAANGVKTKLVAGTDYTLAVDPVSRSATATFTAVGLGKTGGAPISVSYTPGVVKSGPVTIQPGARITSLGSGDGNGGRLMFVAPQVRNEGTLSSPAGQTILAAGQQLGVAAHASNDPSLRGLDVWVGAAAEKQGTATNSGLIEAFTGSVSISGREVNQLGIIESSTSVNLNGRIDLAASFGAVGNPTFDVGAGGPPFLFQQTGLVTFGANSLTRILPDYASERMVPGLQLAEKSQINVTGLGVHFAGGATMLAPSAEVAIRAGIWPYRDPDGNRTTLGLDGLAEGGLTSYYTGTTQRFMLAGGQIYLDPSASINVAGSTDVFVPMAQSILNIELRGSELADSPLQRDGLLRAVPLTVDLRRTGVTEDGRFWIGTPLGDVTGLAGLIQRNAAQLTADGGSVSLQAGNSIVLREGSTIDVSGGFFRHEGGVVETTRLMQSGRLVDIADALPGQIYDGVYTGEFSRTSARWGITETFKVPWMTGEHFEPGYIEGANGGTVALSAASMALDGELLGRTIAGPRQRADAAEQSRLLLEFEADRIYQPSLPDLRVLRVSPAPPTVVLGPKTNQPAPAPFAFDAAGPANLSGARTQLVTLSPDLFTTSGFGHLSVENPDGEILVPRGVQVSASPEGSITLAAKNITVRGDVSAPGGDLSFRVFNLSPSFVEEFNILQATLQPDPAPNVGRGLFTLAAGARLDASGLIVDDRGGAVASQPLALEGGNISIQAFSAHLARGSTIDVSGGALASADGRISYGDGGAIEIKTGKDLSLTSVIGGELRLGSTLQAYSGETGGSLALQAMLIQVGGTALFPNTLLLQPDFFQRGGFTDYALTGIGMASPLAPAPGDPAAYAPAIFIAPGTVIEPRAENWLAMPYEPGSRELALRPRQLPVGLRSPVSLSLTALGSDDDFTLDRLEARGDIVIGAGARIQTDPGASLSLDGDTVTLHGSLIAPGGSIAIKGEDTFPLARTVEDVTNTALPTVHLGPQARLSTAGITVTLPDAFGRRTGKIYDGGVITVYGNIVAESGSVLDVSGASTTFDLHPSRLGVTGASTVPSTSGLTGPLWRLESVPTQVDSAGGLIELEGAQMLLSDATLLGRAGGPTVAGGTLSVHSGRFYPRSSGSITGLVRNTDINLVVTQSGEVLPTRGDFGVGRVVRDGAGAVVPGMGYFAVERFNRGGFDSLDLGAKFLERSPTSPLAFGGNIQFQGPISIQVPGHLRLAAGGVIQADGPVNLTASYVAMGQPFRPPLQPGDPVVVFQQRPAGGSVQDFAFAPTFGPGRLSVSGELIDLGNLSLQNVGRAFLDSRGDIRGNGTVAISGDLKLHAAQVYPTTLATFNLFAYDRAGAQGSVTIEGNGPSAAPLSAGGNLNIFASQITQNGVLRAPLGTINLGWDGTDFDLTEADLDSPLDPVTRGSLPVAVADRVTLKSGSLTSTAALDWATGTELILPFGISPDGFTWIDPRGVNVTTTGLPEKRVSLAGTRVTMQGGATIDIRGGGDLQAFRFVPGTGGSRDLLGSASGEWTASGTYEAGDLVTFRGDTFAARVDSSGERPKIGLFWSRVAESFAVLPSFGGNAAPINAFNPTADLLQGERGYVFSPVFGGDRVFSSLADTQRVQNGVKVGDRIFLSATPGLDAGTYTLLPRRYALYPGAFLVTPQAADPIGTFALPTGATLTTGFRSNAFNRTLEAPVLASRFEVASSEITRARVAYDEYFGNAFFADAAARFEVERPQLLPVDAGYASFHGNTTLRLSGIVLTARPDGGRGAAIDLSSFADMAVIGGNGTAPAGSTVVLSGSVLNSWGAESLLIGGLRRRTPEGMTIDFRTSNLILDNPGSVLFGPEITLAAREKLTLTDGSALATAGHQSEPAQRFTLSGDGALLRVSADLRAAISRNQLTGSTAPLLTVGAETRLFGSSLILDSTYGTQLNSTANLQAQALTLGSGQISIVLGTPPAVLSGSVVDPHLVLAGEVLENVQDARSLTLRSYRSIDVYGAGTFGSSNLGSLSLLASGLRGFDQAGGSAVFSAGNVLFANPGNVTVLPAPDSVSGTLQFDTGTVRLGANTFSVTGYENVALDARNRLLGQSTGAFTTPGNLTVTTPLITGTRGSKQAITAGGALVLAQPSAGRSTRGGGLGASMTFTGASIAADTSIVLPSGEIVLRAISGDVTIGGRLDTAGTQRRFFDLIRYSDAGRIRLTSDVGNVELLAGSTVSVASAGLGKAGTLAIDAANGTFVNEGVLSGKAAEDEDSGSFLLDVGSAGTYASLNDPLQTGGFFAERNLRIRLGSVTIDGTTRARDFTLSADQGSINVTGLIDASGRTGGRIVLVSGGSLTAEAGSRLTVQADEFSSAGKGGSIRLEAGAAINGVSDPTALLDLRSGSTLDLGVGSYVAGTYTDPASSAFRGQFQGTLHLRAPRAGNDIQIATLAGDIAGASSILAEGFRIYDRTGIGTLDNALRNAIHADSAAYLNAGYGAMEARLLAANPNLQQTLVLAPGVEIINRTGDLVLGTNADDSSNDWDLSGFRYGPKAAPGVLTLRAAGDLEFKNALSDGFAGDFSPEQFPNPGQELWLRPLMDVRNTLPVNTQSWSYRLVAGADHTAADFQRLQALDALAPGKGSLLVGKFYPPTLVAGANATTASAIDNRYQVVRTGAGNIDIAAGRDVQLRNQFATIYTAGVRLPYANQIGSGAEPRLMSIFAPNDFAVPLVELGFDHPPQGSLGEIQHAYPAQYSLAGGDLSIFAQQDIGRYTLVNGQLQVDSSRQLPNNWLYRR